MSRIRSLLLVNALSMVAATVVQAQGLRVVASEPGPGSLQGAADCVLVTGGDNKARLCPTAKYMKVCGAPDASTNRRRSCVSK